ncbi:hypothetical protein QYF36_020370 [Acer negundo]|nr:hypothetical protein QYF36_020370 [Acer negundo]
MVSRPLSDRGALVLFAVLLDNGILSRLQDYRLRWKSDTPHREEKKKKRKCNSSGSLPPPILLLIQARKVAVRAFVV